MADFKTALETLAKGEIELETLSRQLDILLDKSPQFANKMLAQLDEIYGQKKLDDQQYTQLKRQINQFRRGHASRTETGDNGSADSTVFSQDSIREAAADAQAPAAQTPTSDSTVVMSEAEKADSTGTNLGASADSSDATDSSDFFDLSVPGLDTSTPSVASATGPVETGWNDPGAPVGDLAGNYGEGSVIKQRFKLEKVLGIGGMGKVYRALDLLKAEAKDKTPYVAIKLLNEDFKDHPEAFIALQRESSRQQKLAHPNIATIYDFDRVGGPGTPVFITMELMEGMELKKFIKQKARPQGGIPFDEAYDIIRQLGLGLIYAHERRLVHSDFKPGNAFLCNNGTVKTLDFGIARVVKNPVTGEAEKTLFDPGQLGALTPAYASLEMLSGEEPDTRDDTYALGCTAYELLTGKHPFNKVPANKAQQNNLVPPYVKTLNKKQNRALRRAVAFHRKDRSPNVGHFLEELEGKATWHKNPFTIAAAVLLIIGAMLIVPIMDYLHQKGLEAMVAEINSGSEAVIVAKLDEILSLEKTDQSTVTDEAKTAIQNYFSDKVANLVDTSGDDYNFPEAVKVIDEIAKFYPESLFLQEQTDLVSKSKKQVIGGLVADYRVALKDKAQIDNTNAILEKIATIEPAHPLLEDPRPSNAYRVFAQEEFENNDFDLALEFINSGLELAQDDPRLSDLRTKIERAQTVAKLESELSGVQNRLSALTDFKAQQSTIVELAGLKPESAIIAALAAAGKPLLEKELDTILKTGSRADAEALAADFGDLMSGLQLNQLLTRVKLAKLTGAERKQKVAEFAGENSSNIESALADARVDNKQWETALLKEVQGLNSLVEEEPGIGAKLAEYRGQIAELYIARATETLQAERFDVADGYVDTAERFAPGLPAILEVRNAVAGAREEFDRKVRIAANKTDFRDLTDADNVAEAIRLFEQLQADIPETDNYIVFEAPKMLGDSFARLASSKAETKDFTAAFSFVSKGLEIDPKNAELGALKDEYQAEANIIELTELFKTAVFFPVDVRLKVSQIENAQPARYAEFSKAAAQTLADRINALKTTDEATAAGLAQAAAGLFPANAVLADLKNELQLKPWAGLATANAAIMAGKLTQATQLQQAAAGEFSGHPDFISFSQTLEARIKEANAVYDIYIQDKAAAGEDYERVKATKNLLARAQGFWTDSPDYTTEERELDQLIARLKPKIRPRIIQQEVELTAETLAAAGIGTAVQKIEWKPIASDAPCETRLAGYGRRAKAICFDMIHSAARGPLMVVVPNGEGFENPFAIAKYEISISDWSKYCILSGTCQAIKDKERKNEPMTGITLKQAQDYAAWLSERTGKTYRIPTRSEWEYAANAGGKQPQKDFNCRVTVGDKLIKGTGIVSVKSGKSNGWGLKNYVGNVQEWVLDGNSTMVRGGAFTDSHSNCDISLERSHDGNADEATGFRLILEEVG